VNYSSWIADYLEDNSQFDVKPKLSPGDVKNRLQALPPDEGENFENSIRDFENIIAPNLTHWQSPNFHAYFNSNTSYESVLGELLAAGLNVNVFSWQTSPAGTELEEVVMGWLRRMIALPDTFEGVIQDTASSASLVSFLTAREKYSDFRINESGFGDFTGFRIYCSEEAHSSIEKGVKIAGFGKNNLVKIPTDEKFAMKPAKLREAIQKDISAGMKPLCVVSTIGTTGSTAVDPVKETGKICREFKLWHHVDAAHAGTAMLLPEYRYLLEGIENVDTFVFNPHKWMFTNFDFSAYFVRDKEALIRTFEIMPEYLKTSVDNRVNNFRDWGIPLGRRFRALKMWFVIRSMGVKGLQDKIRGHIELACELKKKIESHKRLELLAPMEFNTICFRYVPDKSAREEEIDNANIELLKKLNDTGEVFLSHTRLKGKYTIRIVVGQTNTSREHTEKLWKLIRKFT
jgi:aromatic-L-amino-acid decarboxylase